MGLAKNTNADIVKRSQRATCEADNREFSKVDPMNFPRWIRSEVLVPGPIGLSDDELRQRISEYLASRGATAIDVRDDGVHFRADRAVLNINPLAPCREGRFQVRQRTQQVVVTYELDIIYLIWSALAPAAFVSIFFVIALLLGNRGPATLFGAFFCIVLPASYVFYFYQVRSLLKEAVRGEGHR